MKNLNNIYKKLSLILTFTMMTLLGFAQPPLCDTCEFDYRMKWNPKIVDSILPYYSPYSNEFQSCGSGSIYGKNISFIHGLGGNANSWAKQGAWTGQNYETAKSIIDYPPDLQSSFDYITDEHIEPEIRSGDVQVTTSNPGRCKLNDFVIAHSQGGIAARYLDWQWDVNTSGDFGVRQFYGLVTFATPHAGADIALTKSEHSSFVQRAISTVLLYDNIGAKVYDLTDKYGFIFGKSAADILQPIDSLILKKLIPVMLSSIHAPTLDEMKPNSTTMNSVNNHQSRLRKVAFYGVEDAPECWKVMSNISDTASEKYPLWEAVRDNHMQERMENVRSDHNASIVENQRQVRVLQRKANTPVLGLFRFKAGSKVGILNENIEHRQKAVDFLNNANTEWRYLIGSYHRDSLETRVVNKYIVKWDERYGYLSKWYHQERSFYNLDEAISYSDTRHGQVYQIKGKEIVTVQETKQVEKFFPSDGVVLAKSQVAFPGVGNRTDRMEHNNHFQERNSPETERVLVNLYNGEYDSFFTTDKK